MQKAFPLPIVVALFPSSWGLFLRQAVPQKEIEAWTGSDLQPSASSEITAEVKSFSDREKLFQIDQRDYSDLEADLAADMPGTRRQCKLLGHLLASYYGPQRASCHFVLLGLQRVPFFTRKHVKLQGSDQFGLANETGQRRMPQRPMCGFVSARCVSSSHLQVLQEEYKPYFDLWSMAIEYNSQRPQTVGGQTNRIEGTRGTRGTRPRLNFAEVRRGVAEWEAGQPVRRRGGAKCGRQLQGPAQRSSCG